MGLELDTLVIMRSEENIAALLEGAEVILSQAEKMSHQAGNADEDSKKLREIYSPWKAAALRHLDEDQKKRFGDEYSGSVLYPKIRKCLEGIDKRPHVRKVEESLVDFSGGWHGQLVARFINPFREQCEILKEIEYLNISPIEEHLDHLEATGRRLPEVFRELRERTRSHEAWFVRNEYDVQDVLSLVLKARYDDVREEETAPSFAGAGFRMDFWLKKEQIGIEVKMTREALGKKKLRSELLEDVVQYQKFPEAKGLFIYVYDPKHKIDNSSAFEADLNRAAPGFPIRTVVNR